MSDDIYQLVSKLDELAKPKQLPALFKPRRVSPVLTGPYGKENATQGYLVGEDATEVTSEDLISNVKKRLGDYLQDVTNAIKKDPDLLDKVPKSNELIGPAVKTIRTNDGHEIKIHGNEDDGFRISIKNKPSKMQFENLDHAMMAVEMFCKRRKNADSNQDYLEEKQ